MKVIQKKELPYDETDDSYTVIDGPGYEYHDHVPSLYVFAPHYHVPLPIETCHSQNGIEQMLRTRRIAFVAAQKPRADWA